MNINIDCFRDTLKYCIDYIDYEEDNESWITKTVDLVMLYKSKELKQYNKKDIMRSVIYLDECNFINIQSKYPSNKPYLDRCAIEAVTFRGCQFYDSIREETIWEKTKSIVNEVGNHTLSFIEDTAQKIAVTAIATFINNYK